MIYVPSPRRVLCAFVVVSMVACPAIAQTIQVGNKLVKVVTTASWDGATAAQAAGGAVQEGTPTDFAPIPDGTGRLLVSTLGGTVHVLNSAGQIQTLGSPLLSKAQTNNSIDFNLRYGLNSFAVHPDFSNSGTFGYGKAYALVSQEANQGAPDFSPTGVPANNHHSVLYEYDLQDIVGDFNQNSVGQNFSSREVIRIAQAGGSHNAVDIAFRSNGELYLNIGDGTANSLNQTGYRKQYAQNLDEAYGKVFRFSPDPNAFGANGALGPGRLSDNGEYSISAGNPFYDGSNSDSDLDEVYANGLRSPYRINVDPNDEDVAWLGDVGEGNREEVNRIVAGGNYGWGILEGTANAPSAGGVATRVGNDFIAPEFEYSHASRPGQPAVAGGGVSVIGGFIYRGSELGAEFQGQYIGAELGNYFGGGGISRLFYGDPDASSSTQDPLAFLLDQSGSDFDNVQLGTQGLPNGITTIGEDLNGELWVLGFDATISPGVDEGDGIPGKLVVARLQSSGFGPGDVTGDGIANRDDFEIIRDNLGRSVSQRTQGDLNNDNLVDLNDFQIWLVNSNITNSALGASVPEPSSWLVVVLGVCSALATRCSRKVTNEV